MQLAIVLEGPDCGGKSTVAAEIKRVVDNVGGNCMTIHATKEIPSRLDLVIPFNVQDRVAVFNQASEYLAAGCHPFQLFDFVVLDRIDEISGEMYNIPLGLDESVSRASRNIRQISGVYGSQLQVHVLRRGNEVDAWQSRIEEELIKDIDIFNKIRTRYSKLQSEFDVYNFHTHCSYVGNYSPTSVAISVLMSSISGALFK